MVLRLDHVIHGQRRRLLGFAFGHAIGVKAALAVLVDLLDQAVDIGLEARALAGDLARKLQVVDDLAVEHLARDQQRDAGRVRRQQVSANMSDTWLELRLQSVWMLCF